MTAGAENILVITSPDKLGRLFLSQAPQKKNIFYAYDCSSGLKRVVKLISKGRIPLGTVLKMAWADLRRVDSQVQVAPHYRIESNEDLRRILAELNVKTVYLFRAGLILSPKTLKEKVKFLNVHCAKLPEYGGIGVLNRALEDRHFAQEATLHEVVASIDSGTVLATRPYALNPTLSYGQNEDVAYRAGIALLCEKLEQL